MQRDRGERAARETTRLCAITRYINVLDDVSVSANRHGTMSTADDLTNS